MASLVARWPDSPGRGLGKMAVERWATRGRGGALNHNPGGGSARNLHGFRHRCALGGGMWQADGWGWRARLGVLMQHADVGPESELRAMAPEGVSIHAAR